MNGKSAQAVRISWMAAALLPLLVGIAGAQMRSESNAQVGQDQQMVPPDQAREFHPNQMREFHPKLEKADRLIGAKVVDNQGKRLGTVKDIVLTPDRSAIDYVVLAYGAFWGAPERYFAVPWSHFQISPSDRIGDKTLILNVNEDALRSAKGFDKRHWPSTANERWMEGNLPSAPGVAGADIRYRRLDELTGMVVTDRQGDRIGRLADIMIDVQQGKVAYGIVSMRSGFLGIDKDLAAVPWSRVEILPQEGLARLNADKQTLEAVAFNARDFPNLEDPQYSRQLYQRFNATPYWESLGYVPPAGGMEPYGASAWLEGSEYNSLFNANAVETIHGTVKSVGTFRLEGTSIPGLSLQIVTDEGKMQTVHVGPYPYLERQNIRFHPGDKVTIIGSPANFHGRDVFLASQIKLGDRTLALRTNEGKPQWKVEEFREFGAMSAPAPQGSATAGGDYESSSAPAPQGSHTHGNSCD